MDFGSQNPSLIWSVIFVIIISLLDGTVKEIKMQKWKALKKYEFVDNLFGDNIHNIQGFIVLTLKNCLLLKRRLTEKIHVTVEITVHFSNISF